MSMDHASSYVCLLSHRLIPRRLLLFTCPRLFYFTFLILCCPHFHYFFLRLWFVFHTSHLECVKGKAFIIIGLGLLELVRYLYLFCYILNLLIFFWKIFILQKHCYYINHIKQDESKVYKQINFAKPEQNH